MKKLLLLLCACTFPVQAQDTVRVKHSNYDAVFVPVFAIVMPVVLEFTVIDAAVGNTVKEPPPAN